MFGLKTTSDGDAEQGDFAVPRVKALPGASSAEKAEVQEANKALVEMITRLARFDPTASRWRLVMLGIMALVTLLGAGVTIYAILNDAETATVAGVLTALGGIVVGAVMNPLQTVERDIIIRRWSDVIISSWAFNVRAGRSPVSALREASEEFTKLGTTYASITSKTLETVSLSFAKPEESPEKEDLTLKVPPEQKLKQGATIESLVEVTATGGNPPYKFKAEGLPPGITVSPFKGEFIGTVAEDAATKKYPVRVTVTDTATEDGEPASISEEFQWTIESK